MKDSVTFADSHQCHFCRLMLFILYMSQTMLAYKGVVSTLSTFMFQSGD